MDDELNRDEDGEKWENPSPIRCLAYMLGFFTCHVQAQNTGCLVKVGSVWVHFWIIY